MFSFPILVPALWICRIAKIDMGYESREFGSHRRSHASPSEDEKSREQIEGWPLGLAARGLVARDHERAGRSLSRDHDLANLILHP